MGDGGATFTTGSTLITVILIAAVLIAAHFLRNKIREDKKDEEPMTELWLRDAVKLEIDDGVVEDDDAGDAGADDIDDGTEDLDEADREEMGTNEGEDVEK
jgi:hypothetical protein